MPYLHVYKNSPTAGGTDGSLVSEGTELNPISVTVNATNNEVSAAIVLGVRCESGYNTSGNTTITPTGTSASKWQLSLDGITWLDWGVSLVITSVIGVVNTLFYARAKAVSGETPSNDTSINLQISSNVVAV